MVAGRDAFVGDLEEPLRRARKALVSHAEARRAHADALGKRQRNLLAQIAAPGGLRAVTEAIEQGLAGLMDVCEEAKMRCEAMSGWVVEVYADAPQEPRVWFAREAEATAYLKAAGGTDRARMYASEVLSGDALRDLLADARDHKRTLQSLENDLDRARAEAQSARADAQDLHRQLAEARKVAA